MLYLFYQHIAPKIHIYIIFIDDFIQARKLGTKPVKESQRESGDTRYHCVLTVVKKRVFIRIVYVFESDSFDCYVKRSGEQRRMKR